MALSTCRAASGAAPEERAVAERQSAAVPADRQPRRGAPGREQPRDRVAVAVEHTAVGIGVQPAERECGVDRVLGGAVERAERWRDERRHVARILVEDRVGAGGGMAVVESERRGEAAFGQAELALE